MVPIYDKRQTRPRAKLLTVKMVSDMAKPTSPGREGQTDTEVSLARLQSVLTERSFVKESSQIASSRLRLKAWLVFTILSNVWMLGKLDSQRNNPAGLSRRLHHGLPLVFTISSPLSGKKDSLSRCRDS